MTSFIILTPAASTSLSDRDFDGGGGGGGDRLETETSEQAQGSFGRHGARPGTRVPAGE